MADRKYDVPEIEVTSKNKRKVSVGDFAYADGADASGIVVAIALDHLVVEYINEDGDIGRFSDYASNFVTAGPPSLYGKLAEDYFDDSATADEDKDSKILI